MIDQINSIKDLDKISVKSDKTKNLYAVDKNIYNRFLSNSIRNTYKEKINNNLYREVNIRERIITSSLKVEYLPHKPFITLKDHKDSFNRNNF